MEALDALDAELLAFASVAETPTTSSVRKRVANCCGKSIDKCQCSSTRNTEEAFIFTASTSSLEEFAFTKHVMQLVSYPNILSCLFMDITSQNVSSEFISFIAFIQKRPDRDKSQLATLVLPVTVHLYALLMQCDDIGVEGAKKFLSENVLTLNNVEGYKEVSSELSSFNNIEELKQNPHFAHYFESKTVIKMSNDVFQSLQNYLRDSKDLRKETLLVYVLSLHIDFENSDVCNCPNESKKNKKKESNGELKKRDIETGGKKELELEDSNLKNIEISNILIEFRNPGQNYKFYDFDTEEMYNVDNITEYMESLKHSKAVDAKPVRLRNTPRNVSNRLTNVKSKTKEIKVDSTPKKEMEAKPNVSYKSLHSLDFNSAMTEIAYAVGDTFIYTMKIITPKKKKKKMMKVNNIFTVLLRNFEHDENCWKKTKDLENQNVYAVKYLPEEPFSLLVASGSKVRLFNTDLCVFQAVYITDGSFIYDIDVDSTGQYFATANHDLASYIYSFHHSARVCMLTGHEYAVTAVKFHPNGIYVATGSEDCTVRLFEVESGHCVRLFVGHVFGIWVLDFSYDGHLIASADSSGVVNVWDIKECSVISEMNLHTGGEMNYGVNSLCFHENCFILAACCDKGEVRLWDARNPEHKHTVRSFKKPVKIKRHKGKGWSVAYILNKGKSLEKK